MDDHETTAELDAKQLLAQIYDFWVQPELDRRGLDIRPEQLTKALIVMAPGRPVGVFFDDEARLVAHVRATRAIAEGENVTGADFDDLRQLMPASVDPDAGWVCFVRINGNTYVAFDFRRNRGKARRKLDRAGEFLATASASLSAGHTAVAVDTAYAAAELAVTAEMMQMHDDPARDHQVKRRWWKDWTELGNAPTEQGRAFAYLAAHRGAARYADRTLTTDAARLERVLETVADTIAHARSRVGDEIPAL